jgi:hypothetical protein
MDFKRRNTPRSTVNIFAKSYRVRFSGVRIRASFAKQGSCLLVDAALTLEQHLPAAAVLNGSKYSARDIDCAARSVASPTPKPLLTQIRLGAEPTSAKFLVPSQNKKLLYGAPGLLNRAVPLLTINSVLEKHLPEASISSRWTRMDSI